MKKHTPLDALVKAPRKSAGYKKCKKVLCGAGGKRAKELSQALKTTHRKNTWKAHANWLNETKSTLMVVAILIATMTFQAALNPPGGVWQDDYPPSLLPGDNITAIRQWYADYDSVRNKSQARKEQYKDYSQHHAGESVMSSERPLEYLLFSFSNLIGFLSTASIILLLISGFNLKRSGVMWALMFAMWISIGSMVFSYSLSLATLTDYDTIYRDGLYFLVILVSIISSFAAFVLVGLLVTAHVVRLVILLCKKFKRRAGSEMGYGSDIEVSMDRNPSP
ncbi:hypothetical protein MRB53_027873 [Persea americana]|uniref:Uncharacterized protein n=1 Tax=Persea americana TaxID=3435 RepID=A0ACC2KDX1_PERAE|nr:hypothetical protein MRB53_027873 [Persea americana]